MQGNFYIFANKETKRLQKYLFVSYPSLVKS